MGSESRKGTGRGRIAALFVTAAVLAWPGIAPAGRGPDETLKVPVRAGSPAPPKYNLIGRWTVGGNNGAEKGGMHITRMSMSTGRFTGTSYAGRFVVKGREIGTSITVRHIVGTYVSTDIGRITDGGRKMGGTYRDTSGRTGTWYGVKHKRRHPHA
jgi:hypothetical protein